MSFAEMKIKVVAGYLHIIQSKQTLSHSLLGACVCMGAQVKSVKVYTVCLIPCHYRQSAEEAADNFLAENDPVCECVNVIISFCQ